MKSEKGGIELALTCPKCSSENTKIYAQVKYTDSIDFDWKKKGFGVRQQKNKHSELLPEEIRVFFRCYDCDYLTDNLNGPNHILNMERETSVIVKQVTDSVKGRFRKVSL
jgi:hypothetical protein